ncbi:hypothetical protein PMAYCL1PPCAC_10313, partial [Pristionchus mayeri]
ALYFVILWHDVLTVILQVFQITKRLTARTPCEMQFDRRICILRVIITAAYPSFPCLHAAVTVQRIVTTFTGSSKVHHIVARSCLMLTLAYCIFYVV